MLEAGRRQASVGLDVRYHASNPGDIGLAGQLGVFPTTRVTILVCSHTAETKPFARLDLAPAP
jgi:hypothetical protein